MQPDAAWFDAKAIDAIFLRALSGQLEPRTVRRLREAGVDLTRTLEPIYPRERVLEALAIVAEELAPGEPPDRAHRILGDRLVRGFVSGWKGRALATAARAMGADRALSRVVGTHRTPTNFLEVRVEKEAPGAFAVELNWGAPNPELLHGMVAALLSVLGARGARVAPGHARAGVERIEIRL